jgi:hypothetical protein
MARAYVAAVAPLLLLGALLFFGAATPGYDPIKQTISELGPGIRGTTLIAVYGLVIMTCVWPPIAMSRGLGISNRVFITSMESIGVGCVGIRVFRAEPWPWDAMGVLGHLHLISAFILVFAAIPVACLAASRALPKAWRAVRFYSIATGLSCLGIFVATLVALGSSPRNPFAASHLGLIERTYVFAFLVWQCIVSATLVRSTSDAR